MYKLSVLYRHTRVQSLNYFFFSILSAKLRRVSQRAQVIQTPLHDISFRCFSLDRIKKVLKELFLGILLVTLETLCFITESVDVLTAR